MLCTLDLSLYATACMFSGLCLPCYCMNICVTVSGFIAWKRSLTSLCVRASDCVVFRITDT